jgi:TP901 family phage tail tape measure protein
VTTIASFVAQLGLDTRPLSIGLQRGAQLLNKFGGDAEKVFGKRRLLDPNTIAGQGATAASRLVSSLESTFARRRADLQESLYQGLISTREFERAGRLNAEAYNRGITSGMRELGDRGLLTDDIQSELASRYKKGGRRAAEHWADGLARGSAAMRDAGGALTMGVTIPIAAAGAAVLKFGGDFERAMLGVKTKTGVGTDEMRALEAAARKAGAQSVFSANDAAQAMEFLATTGFSAREIITAIPGVMQLAASAGLDMARATDIATSQLGAFGLAASDLEHVNDVLVKVTTSSKVSIEDLNTAMRYVGPFARSMGISLEESAAAMELLAKNGIRGQKAGTGLRGVMAALLDPSKKSAKIIEELGLNAVISGGRITSFAAVIEKLGQTDPQKLAKIFGRENVSAIAALQKEGSAALIKLTRDLEKSQGTAAKVAAVTMSGFKGAIEELKGALEELAIAFAQSGLLRVATEMARGLAGMFRAISQLPAPLKIAVGALATFAAVAGPLLLVLGGLGGAIVNLRMASLALAGAGGMGALAKVLAVGGPVVIGLSAAAAAIYYLTRAQKTWKDETDAVRGALEQLTEAQLNQTRAAFETARAQALAKRAELGRKPLVARDNAGVGGGAAGFNIGEWNRQSAIIDATSAQLRTIGEIQTRNAERAAAFQLEMRKAHEEAKKLAAELAGGGAGGTVPAYAANMDKLAERVSLVTRALEHVRETGNDINGLAKFSADVWADVAARLREAGNGMDETSDKLRGMIEQLERASGLRDALKGLAGGPGGIRVTPSAAAMAPAPMAAAQIPALAQMPNLIVARINDVVRTIGSTISGTVMAAFGPMSLLMQAINEILEPLYPLLDALLEPFRILGQMLAVAVVPVLRLLFPIIKAVAIILSYFGEITTRVSAGFATAIGHLIVGLGKAIDKIPGVSAKGMIKAGEAVLEFADGQYHAADQIKRMRKELEGMTFDKAAERVNRLGEAAADAAEAFTNIPSWFKTGAAIYGAAQPRGGMGGVEPMGGGVITTTATDYPSTGAGGGTTIQTGDIIISGDLGSRSDVRTTVRELIAELRRQSSLQFGTPERWAEVV